MIAVDFCKYLLTLVWLLSVSLYLPLANAQSEQDETTAIVVESMAADNTEVVDTDAPTTPDDESVTDDNLADEPASLAEQVEAVKQAALKLNRDLLILEEELLFPGNTQVAVFISMDVGEFFQLDSVKVKIDDKLVASHLYTERQISALYRGGVQRIYVGNVKSGEHEISAFFIGKGPEGRDYKRGAKLSFEKTTDPTLLELRIIDSTKKLQPVFDVKEWQL